MSRYADVIVDIMNSATDRLFSYKIPSDLTIEIGMRVLVPFGSQKKEGYVLDIYDESKFDEAKTKSILSASEEYPLIKQELIYLAKRISKSAHCPLAMAIRLMLPANVRNHSVKIKKQHFAQLKAGIDMQSAKKENARSSKRKLLLDLLSDGESHPMDELKLLVRNPQEGLLQLAEQGYVTLSEKEVFRQPYALQENVEEEIILTDAQKEALSEIIPGVQRKKGKFLLHGITGSGKTEVYIRAVKECLKMGRSAIVLVPEIILTPQMVAWFRGRFGKEAAVLHSRLTPGEQFDQWRRIRFGDAKVVIGARSAIFAPVHHLGLIIIDEEQEQSYFSDRNPQYDAREIADIRAEHEGACLLLASATPSIQSFNRAMNGDMIMLEMPTRANGKPLPSVSIVDMREEIANGNRSMFSRELKSAMDECLRKGEQMILFVNRRGYAPTVVCRKCGETLECDACDVSLTYHEADRRLHCHYCGKKTAMPPVCPVCGSKYLKTCGVGTQKVEEEIKKLYPSVPCVRLDMDSTKGRDMHQKLVNSFRSGEAKIMIGTQMIAKGLDFPNVSLVGAILADLSVNLPDFRAAERSFQLLTQVAGRAGRSETSGRVIIQSYKPEHYAIQLSASQDYRAFFEKEIDRRKKGLYPPYTKMLRLMMENAKSDILQEEAMQIYQMLRETLKARPDMKKLVIFYRLDDAPIKYIMGRHRKHILIKLINKQEADEILRILSDMAGKNWQSAVSLEINPASFA